MVRRSLCALLALLLALVSITASENSGGDGGWINVPGGSGAKIRSSTGGPPPASAVTAVRAIGAPIVFALSPDMADSMAMVRRPGGGHVLLGARGQRLEFSATALQTLAKIGVEWLHATIVAPNGLTVSMSMKFDLTERTVLIFLW
ncbi:MAG: hypothetical protein AAF628_06955 [Planctomycetota bacterium]